MPNLEAGDKENWRIWLNSLKLISKMQINHIVPGHGKVLYGAEIKSEIERITNILEQAIKNNKAPTKIN
jgi:flavorubredoxin